MKKLARPDLGTWGDREINQWMRDVRDRQSWVTFSWNPPNVPAASTVDTVLTTSDGDFAGLRAGQSVNVTPPAAIEAGLVWGAFVATDDTITIRLGNVTALDVNPASGTWTAEGWNAT